VNAEPLLLRRLRELGVVDEPREQALRRDGILTAADLDLALAEKRGCVDAAEIRDAAVTLAAEGRPLLLGRAWDILEHLLPALESHCPDLQAIEPSGAVRRSEPLVNGLVVVARAADPARAVECIAQMPAAAEVLHRTPRRVLVIVEGQEIDIRVATPDEYGSVLFSTTGPASHVVDVLKRRGPRISGSEAGVYAHAGLALLAAETRDAPDAIDRARQAALPRLVDRDDIRGDLHMHTTYSDGREPLRRMVHGAHVLGYEYIAITDHSEHAGASRTLTPELLERQRAEIAQLRHELPHMAILHGIEADIMPDGSLDCPDDILATLDIVLASLHDAAGGNAARLTRRCLAAIEHPLVSVITHPANQLVGRRAGYEMDYDAIYAAAAETGTALEIDGAPSHLDLSGERARDAVDAGVTVVIDSDCHRVRALDRQMRMGVGTARRGWVEPRHVLNTRPIAEVRAFIARKRAR
jgi:DNA polymerase (family 10)